MGVKRSDERRMGGTRVEIGEKEKLKKKLVRSTWTGHVEKLNWG